MRTNVRRIQNWKERLGSKQPYLDSFFVMMRSNFREIPAYLSLMHEYGFSDVSLQTVEINEENSGRFPMLERDEVIKDRREVEELHSLLRDLIPRERQRFRMIRVSGLTTLFEKHGLDNSFLLEEAQGLYPDSDGMSDDGFELCPNPWTTMFVIENGDVHLCFLATAIGNLYEAPLESIWNSPRALAKRSHMLAGRYLESGCAPHWCSWREGKKAAPKADPRDLLVEIKELRERAASSAATATPVTDAPIASVRRMLASRERRIRELESMFRDLCDTNAEFHNGGQRHIDHLEAKLSSTRKQLEDARQFQERRLVRLADRVSGIWATLTRNVRSAIPSKDRAGVQNGSA